MLYQIILLARLLHTYGELTRPMLSPMELRVSDQYELNSSRLKPHFEKRPSYLQRRNVRETSGGENLLELSQECQQLQCQKDGLCLSQMNSLTRCFCRLGYSGKLCEKTVSFQFPRFSGRSFLKFSLPSSVETMISVSLYVRPQMATGLVLYAGGRSNSTSHFISLSLQQGQFEFRFNCGFGVTVIRSQSILSVHQWHYVAMLLSQKSSWLMVNDTKSNVPHRSTRNVASMQLADVMFFGHVPHPLNPGGQMDVVTVERSGMDVGLVGCIRHLMLNGQLLDLRRKPFIGDALDGLDIHNCAQGCREPNRCYNGGRCKITVPPNEYVCKCPLGSSGKHCEHHESITKQTAIPRFLGDSYMRFRKLRKTSSSQARVEMVFKPEAPNGIIFYNGFSMDRRGDFLTFLLNNGSLEVMYDLGTGPAKLKSRYALNLNEWHEATFILHGRFGKLTVNTDEAVIAYSSGHLVQLTLKLDLFLGGHRNLDEMSHFVTQHTNFQGCIQRLIINQQTINFKEDVKQGVNILPCSSHVCIRHTNVCQNNGNCIPKGESFHCDCPNGFHGIRCQKAKEKDENDSSKLNQWPNITSSNDNNLQKSP